ncbi:MAG: M14 family metallopeptidase [Syntrophomonadaceae bacterium]
MRRIAVLITIVAVCIGLIAGADSAWKKFKVSAPEPPPQQPVNQSTPEPAGKSGESVFTKQVYGYSGEQRELEVYRISATGRPYKKLLCVFALHGFEDAFYRDGRLLTDTARYLTAYFKEHSQELGAYELLVVPAANPDGAARGTTCKGPGRCQISLGIDMNMDFDYSFKPRTNPRNLTGSRPFSSPESQALRDLVLNEKPDIVIDFHGWVNSAAGDPQITAIFNRLMGLSLNSEAGSIKAGYFSGWAGKYTRSVLVEYPDPFRGRGAYDKQTEYPIDYNQDMVEKLGYGSKTVECIKEIAKQSS